MTQLRRAAFRVDGKPVGQPRHRAARNKGGKAIAHYIPRTHPVHVFKQMVALYARAAWQRTLTDKPVMLWITSWFRWRGPKKSWKPFHAAKPDEDNITKAIKDAMTGVVYLDDAQVAICRHAKRHLPPGRTDEHVVVSIAELPDGLPESSN